MLWPNIDNPPSGYRLAATGAIRDTALDIQDVAAFVAEFLLDSYPERLIRRYDIESLPGNEIELLETIARRRGCIVSGGRVDFEKVSRLLLGELRAGDLGGICLELPESLAEERRQAEIRRQQRAAAREASKAARRK